MMDLIFLEMECEFEFPGSRKIVPHLHSLRIYFALSIIIAHEEKYSHWRTERGTTRERTTQNRLLQSIRNSKMMTGCKKKRIKKYPRRGAYIPSAHQ